MDDCSNLDETSETDLPEEKNISVKAINEEDLISGTYTIEDVLLPLPGSRVIYPSNDIGKVYCDLAQKDGISLTETAHKIKEFSITNMTGAYRRVFQKPKDFEWELISYTDGTIPLAETDFDVIAKSVKKSKAREENSVNGREELPAADGTSSAICEVVTCFQEKVARKRLTVKRECNQRNLRVVVMLRRSRWLSS